MSDDKTQQDRGSAEIGGMHVTWDAAQGRLSWSGAPAVAMWVQSSLLGLMSGFHKMVGTERFNLALQAEGRKGAADDWQFIATFPSFEEGFRALGHAAGGAGWGRWELVSLDRGRRRAVFRVHAGWEGDYQRMLGVSWGSSLIAGKFAGLCHILFGREMWPTQTASTTEGDAFDEFVIEPSERSIETEVDALLTTDQATRADLAVALERLKRELAERTALREDLDERRRIEQELREQLALNERQERAIRAMTTPIIQVWHGVLTLPVVGILTAERASRIMTGLLAEIGRKNARFAIIDVTGVEDVDVSTAEHLLRIVRATELMGARAIVSGVGPAVAQTISATEVDLTGIVTVATLQQGLELCMRELGGAARGSSA